MDVEGGDKIVSRRVVKNPHFVLGRGHGMMFAREVNPNMVVTRDIGENAKRELESLGVEVKIVGSDFNVEEFLS